MAGLNLLPWPRSLDTGTGAWRLTNARFELISELQPFSGSHAAVRRLSEVVARRTGLPGTEINPTPIRVRCAQPSSGVPGIDQDEGYWLVVDDAGIYLDAATGWGVLRGIETLAQLVTADGTVPHVAIDDGPRFSWRGLLLDPARHFLSIETLLRTLDGMASCKLNVLHLHLTDDQGFRFHVPEHPKLASTEAYSAEELARIVAHAAGLGIRVIPEIDMPGHVTSWLTAYPEWGAHQVSATERFGVHGACLDPTSDAVFKAIGSILDTLVTLFPDPCLHIGGDEVSPRWWSEDPKVAELMVREKLPDVRAVQGYFNRRVGRMVAERGRVVVAWDEVLDAGHGGDWIIQAWRGATMRDRALAAGNRVLVSAPYYLDLHYPTDLCYGVDPAAPQDELLSAENALLADPRLAHVAEGIRWTEQWRVGAVDIPAPISDRRVLGGEACLWSELVTDEVLDQRLWSRLPAVAERFWSSATLQDVAAFNSRQDWFTDRMLAEAGIDLAVALAAQLERLGVTAGWSELVAMLEPVKWYGRLLGAEALAARIQGQEMPQARPYNLASKLDRLIDHLPVESRVARELARLCNSSSVGAADELDGVLRRWQVLAEAHSEAPLDLGPLAVRLGGLGECITARLHEGRRTSAETIAELLMPVDEFVLAMPPALYDWLTES